MVRASFLLGMVLTLGLGELAAADSSNLIKLPGFLPGFILSQDGKFLASHDTDLRPREKNEAPLFVFDVRARKQLWTKTVDDLRNYFFLEEGKRLILVERRALTIVNSQTGEPEISTAAHAGNYPSVATHPNQPVVYISDGGCLTAFSTQTLARLTDFACIGDEIRGLTISSDGGLLYSGDDDGGSNIWDTATGKMVSRRDISSWFSWRPSVSRDGKIIVHDAFASRVTIQRKDQDWLPNYVYGTDSAGGPDVWSGQTVICPGGEAIAIVDDKRLLFLDANGKTLLETHPQAESLFSLGVSPTSTCRFLTVTPSGYVMFWSPSQKSPIRTYKVDLSDAPEGFHAEFYGDSGNFLTWSFPPHNQTLSNKEWGVKFVRFWQGL